MATKWNGWTARPAIKIICFILLIALILVGANRFTAVLIRSNETGISPAVVFADPSSHQQFFSQHMRNAVWRADEILYYGDESAIRARMWERANPWGHPTVSWQNDEQGEGLLHIEVISLEEYNLFLEEYEWQIRALHRALNTLNNTEGLLFYLQAAGASAHTNLQRDQWGTDFFTAHPVYFIVNPSDGVIMPSHFINFGWGHAPGATMHLAFTQEVVAAHGALYEATRAAYIRDFTLMAAGALLALVLLVILLLGAGRRHGMAGVQFQAIDRPYLDLSLAAVILWGVLVTVLIFELNWFVSRYGNAETLGLLFTAAAVLMAVPALLWLMSFAKRIKAGRFWRHTLLFQVPARCGGFVIRIAKSLWAGLRLTVKVGIIAAAAFALLLIVGAMGINTWHPAPIILLSLLFTAIVTFFLLRYARRIHLLTEGARRAADGSYDEMIQVRDGELGIIADSINNISEGINRAVDERMKSERLKTELITNVSHDIRTPLTSIITYTDLLKQEGLTCESAPEYLDVLIQKSARLKTLTDELFEAAKAASGNIEVRLETLDFVSLMEQVLGELDEAVQSSGLELRKNLPDQLLLSADGKLLWRVMENLLSNVFKYALPGSRVYLDAGHTETVVIVELKNISAMELNMDPSELTERFKRGDDARTDGGAGLGLAIVQSFIAAQGGSFTISIDGDLFKASVCLPRP